MEIMAANKEKQASRRRMNKRALTSLFMFFSFLWLVPSGITIHFSADDAPTGFVYHVAESLHWTASLIFFAAIVLDMALNWKALKRQIMSRTNEYLTFNKETVLALIVVSTLILLITSHVKLL